jgi:hypothetical protein
VSTSSARPTHNRLSDTIECSQPLPKNFNPKFSTLSIQKHYPTPEWCAGCSQPLAGVMTTSQHVYEVHPRKDHRGVDLISDALPFGAFTKPGNAIDYAKFRSRSHHAVIRVYDDAGNVIETHEHAGQAKHRGK